MHHTSNELTFEVESRFNFISLNDIIDYGINDEEMVFNLLKRIESMLDADGIIQIGRNASKFGEDILFNLISLCDLTIDKHVSAKEINKYSPYPSEDMNFFY